MKRILLATFLTSAILIVGLATFVAPATAADPCIATCTGGMLYVCCPHIECVPIHENCSGPKCKCVDRQVWDCWYEYDPMCAYQIY